MSGVRAVLARPVKGAPSDDGKYGLIGFERERPAKDGETSFWIGVPTGLIPALANSALNALPKPDGISGQHPVIFQAERASVGLGPDGQIVFTWKLEEGGVISIEIDEVQAHGLAETLALVIGETMAPRRPSDNRPN